MEEAILFVVTVGSEGGNGNYLLKFQVITYKIAVIKKVKYKILHNILYFLNLLAIV